MRGTDHDPEFYEDDDETADSVWARFRQADKVKTERPGASEAKPGGAIRVPTGDLQVTLEGVRLIVESAPDVTISR